MTATVRDLAERARAIRDAQQQAQQASRDMAAQLGAKRRQAQAEAQPETPQPVQPQ